jgi:dihydroorotase
MSRNGVLMSSFCVTGRTVFPDGIRPATIVVEEGLIQAVLDAQEDQCGPEVVFPGFIDIHVHAREYRKPPMHEHQAMNMWQGATRKETFGTAGKAAINGGVTLMAAMPNDPEPPDNPAYYHAKVETAASSYCPVVVLAAVTKRSEPWADVPYKVYLDSQPSAVSFTSWRDLEDALSRYRGCHVFFHAEDPDVLRGAAGSGPRWRSRPPEAETKAVEKLLEMTSKLGLRSHICHVSTARAALLIHEYNSGSSVPVTCEVTPHHIFFSVDDGRVCSATGAPVEASHLLECNPPLRSEPDRRFLVEALRKGLVDVLASDHAPHTLDDKARGAPGMPHLDTMGPFAGWLIRGCGFSPMRTAEILSQNPGIILSPYLDVSQGTIEPGWCASLTVLDLYRTTVVEGAEIRGRGALSTRCGWSPFSRIELPAEVRRTIVGGRDYLF